MSDDAKPVCNNACLIGIAEMPVDNRIEIDVLLKKFDKLRFIVLHFHEYIRVSVV